MRLLFSALAVWACGSEPTQAQPSGAADCLAGLEIGTRAVDEFAPGKCAIDALQSCQKTRDDAFCMTMIADDLLAHYDALRPQMPKEPNLDSTDGDGLLGGLNLRAPMYPALLAEADKAFDALRTSTACDAMGLETDEFRCRGLLGISSISTFYQAINAGDVTISQ